MAATTEIAWCDSTFNPWLGCTQISPACDSCYAAVSTPARALKIEWGPGKPRHRTSAATWRQPLVWERQHEKFFAELSGRRGTMAYADYRHCDVCDCKAFYDANLDYDMDEHPDTGLYNLGEWKVLCRDCAKTHEVVIVERAPGGR